MLRMVETTEVSIDKAQAYIAHVVKASLYFNGDEWNRVE